MATKREGDPDETTMVYPSPTAEAMSAGPFYSTEHREDEADNSIPDDVNGHVHLAEHVHQDNMNHDPNLDPEMEQPQNGQPANLEELQLAAQLGQGLADAPMMNATDPNMSVEDPSLRNIMPEAEGEHGQMHQEHAHDHHEQTHGANHEQLPDQLPEHHQEHVHEQHHQQQPQDHDQSHEIPQAQVHAQPPSQPQGEHHPHPQQYMPEPPTSESLVPHGMPMPVPPQIPPHYTVSNEIPPRKRSKVSRACDECRRKKIKCDATSDSGDSPCTSCSKSSIKCLFSRVPQKRGPSKGYIKELADRIHSIEHKLQSEDGLGHEDLEKFFAQERQRSSTGGADDTSRKRPFSSISGNELSTPNANNRQTPWGSDARSTQAGAETFENYTGATLAPQPLPIKPDETPAKQPEASMDVPMSDTNGVPEVGADILHDYVTFIQPLYPVLPNDRSKLQTLLGLCPPDVRNGFLNAVMAVAQPAGGNAKLASSLLFDWENSSGQRTPSANIVHAQALILLIIDADWRRSTTLPFLLSRAVALANTMGLWKAPDMDAALQADSDEQLRVRIWWSLVLLDRWHAVGSGKPVQIPETSVVVPTGLDAIVDGGCYQLIRLSKFMGKAATSVSSLTSSSPLADPMIASVLNDYLENFREDLPAYITPNEFLNVHLAYWHSRVLLNLLTPTTTPSALLWSTTELITHLSAEPEAKTPLTHHFTNLLIVALSKLLGMEAVKESALQLARDLLEQSGSVWDDVREKLARMARLPSSVEAAASQGLQHLADLATAGGGEVADASEHVVQDDHNSLVMGYLDLM